LIFSPVFQPVKHSYSDKIILDPNEIPCYSIEDVLSEKIRALIQRSYIAPSDFFDIWYLTSNKPDIDYSLVVDGFHRKMAFKELSFTGIDQLINPANYKSQKAAWENSLAHKLPAVLLVDYEKVKSDLIMLFERTLNLL